MNYLVIGLGSMGTRRVRNLQALEQKSIAGFDPREDRRQASENKYSIQTYTDIEVAISEFKPDAFVISTPPDLHMEYANLALKHNIHCFIEASVVDRDKIIELDIEAKKKNLIMAPSCTMRFYPGPKEIKRIIQENLIGDVLNINYITGQYLPDWHPWEDIKDFYVSKRETGGAREIVPFELTWLNDIFGDATPISCHKNKITNMDVDIDDIYHCMLKYNENTICNLTVDVVSRPKATREMRIYGSSGLIVFSADTNSVKFINTQMDDWKVTSFEQGTVESNYINPEEPYIEEMRAFKNSVLNKDQNLYPNSLDFDQKILDTLNKLEEMSN
jgi:predicted dehydrogenase